MFLQLKKRILRIFRREPIPPPIYLPVVCSVMVYARGQDYGVEYFTYSRMLTEHDQLEICAHLYRKWGDTAIVSFSRGEQDWDGRRSWPVTRMISGPDDPLFGGMVAFWKTSLPEEIAA